MCAVHPHGVMTIPVSFCECVDPVREGRSSSSIPHNMSGATQPAKRTPSRLRTPEPLQLLRVGLYPASWSTPRTFFTVSVMKHYHLLSLQGNLSAQDFYAVLSRSTDNIDPKEVPVSVGESQTGAQLTTGTAGPISGIHGLNARVLISESVQAGRSNATTRHAAS